MANLVIDYSNPAILTFDSNKIDVSSGLAKVKENLSNIYARWHLNESIGSNAPDDSGNGRDGTLINAPSWVAGKLNNALSFNGSNQYVDAGNIANFERTQAFSVAIWVKTSMAGAAHFINHIQSGSPFTGWQFYKNTSQVPTFSLVNNASTNTIQVRGSTTINTGSWTFVVLTYDGSSVASGVQIYVNNVAETMFIDLDNLSLSTLFTINLNIGRRSDATGYVNGEMDEINIYDRVLTATEINYLWNNGNGREDFIRYSDKPTVEKTDLFDPATVVSWDAFLEILGGGNQGLVGYNLYKVDKANKYYWNGSAWVTGGSSNNFNIAATLNTNISSFDATPDKIGILAYLISDGFQKVEIDENQITYTENQNPLVNAGTNKSTFDNLSICPFSDCSFSDIDGTVDFARYKVDGEVDVWTNIPQNGYGSLLEAVQAFDYQFVNPGILIVRLQVEDNEGAKSEDSLTVTVNKYTVTFNVKDNQGNHLANIQFNAGDGSGWQSKNSPFTYDYDFSSTDLTATFDKDGYAIITITVSTTIHTEDLTLSFSLEKELKEILGEIQNLKKPIAEFS